MKNENKLSNLFLYVFTVIIAVMLFSMGAILFGVFFKTTEIASISVFHHFEHLSQHASNIFIA